MDRSYAGAIAALNNLQSNFAVIKAIQNDRKKMNELAIPEMRDWVRKIGYEPRDFNRLNLIHIAGTKGKGSTSAFISSILAQFTPSHDQPAPLLTKIGLYTSPHLRFVRERIQINNKPLTEEKFTKYFFEVWDRLEEAARKDGKPADLSAKPGYFRYLTLMAFHTYMSEGVDTAIIECGIGGEYDSTNVLVLPTVTGITSLGIDHTAILGSTIEDIAWHKAGIMKPNAPCFTVEQPPLAHEVLQRRAEAVPTSLNIAPSYTPDSGLILGLAAPFQFTNASLAIAIASAHLRTLGAADRVDTKTSTLPREFICGLETTRWPGRCEIRHEHNLTWHIDSAHTIESIKLASSWFANQIALERKNTTGTRILLLNQQTRDANALARALHQTMTTTLADECSFTHVVFCSNVTYKDRGYMPDLQNNTNQQDVVQSLQVQKDLAKTWSQIDPGAVVEVKGSIEEAVQWCRDLTRREEIEPVKVLVTGSVHLVGGFLEVLEGNGVQLIKDDQA